MYEAAWIHVTVEVQSYEKAPEGDPRFIGSGTHPVARTTKLEFREVFKEDADLRNAVAALADTIIEAATR